MKEPREPKTPYQKLTARIEKALKILEKAREDADERGYIGSVTAYSKAILVIREAMNPRKK